MPRKKADPTGLAFLRQRAIRQIRRRFRLSAKRIRALVDDIPHTTESVPGDDKASLPASDKRTATLLSNATNYTWLIDDILMEQTADQIRSILGRDILDGNDRWSNRWFLSDFIGDAHAEGTAASIESAKRITDGVISPVAASQLALVTTGATLLSTPYLRRIGLIQGRIFEEMKGLTSEMTADLRRVLTESMMQGVGIRDIKGAINKQVGFGMVRAERIARTEINRALRTGYMDEAKEINRDILADDDWKIMQMHVSALSPTTRMSHAARHGGIYTEAQQQKWWSEGANSIECLCHTADVLQNKKTGEILQQVFVDRTKARGVAFFKSGGGS